MLSSSLLNEWLGHEIFFKMENFQKIGAFKARGAINTLLALKEEGKLPKKVVAYSSGNHAQGVAWASKILGVSATIVMPSFTSKIKQQATKAYGAELIITETRQQAEEESAKLAEQGAYLIPPFDHDMVIVGQGTACYEVLKEGLKPDSIFASCGGGGWLSGTYLAKELLHPKAKVFGVEPLQANDATRSYNSGQIFKFQSAPETIADGVRTPAVSERTFQYLKKLDGFYEVEEENIIYWTQWLTQLLKCVIEPTSALSMAGAVQWLKTQKSKQKVLIMISGGNIDPTTHKKIWENSYLEKLPKL